MRVPRGDIERLAKSLDGESLTTALSSLGWERYGGQENKYARYRPSGARDRDRLVIPLDDGLADYRELIREAVFRLATSDPKTFNALRAIEVRAETGDEVGFEKDVRTRNGAIPWAMGEEIFRAARGTLLAGAKASVSQRAYFGNRHGRFAHEFLNACYMGQTRIGSYVVTAYTPVGDTFFAKKPKDENRPLPNDAGSVVGREVTLNLSKALEATTEALTHYRRTHSLAGFEEGVRLGVSKELLESVHDLVAGGDAGQVSVRWSANPKSLVELTSQKPVAFEFDRSAIPTLERASRKLASLTPTESVRVTGWVSVVRKPKRGANGLIELKVIAGSNAPTLRIPVTHDQFEIAANACAQDEGLTVSGSQEKEGRTYYLYNASNLNSIPLPPIGKQSEADTAPGRGAVEGQLTID